GDLADEYCVENRQARSESIPLMYRAMAEIARERTTDQLMKTCASLDIPATLIYGIDELMDHPQLQAVSLFQTMQHPHVGQIRYVNPATKFSATPASVRFPAPSLGQH